MLARTHGTLHPPRWARCCALFAAGGGSGSGGTAPGAAGSHGGRADVCLRCVSIHSPRIGCIRCHLHSALKEIGERRPFAGAKTAGRTCSSPDASHESVGGSVEGAQAMCAASALTPFMHGLGITMPMTPAIVGTAKIPAWPRICGLKEHKRVLSTPFPLSKVQEARSLNFQNSEKCSPIEGTKHSPQNEHVVFRVRFAASVLFLR